MRAKRSGLRPISGLRRCESGASAAEFALVLPLFLILIFSVIAAGLMMHSAMALQRATEVSARCLSAQRADCTIAGINTFALTQYEGPYLENLAFVASDADAECDGYRVTATGTFNWFEGSGLLSAPLNTSACYPGPY